ncbi:MAG: hypothetical protein ACE5GW_09710, partial [Planctomycetota bacterium]
MTVSLKLDGLLSPPLPPGRGAERQDVAASMLRIAKAMKEIRLERPGFIETLDDLDGLEDVRRAAEGLREFRHIAVLGIGGSALG